ncbi:MAG: ABC transporter ATP-binding protein, partial [Planctomycetota bacterium]
PDVLMLDEPTNHLDIDSILWLEHFLAVFPQTLIFVTHDRAFLNNVVTSMIVFEPTGVREYVGGYDDWLRQSKVSASGATGGKSSSRATVSSASVVASATKPSSDKPMAQKLSYKEKLELESLPSLIEKLESQQTELHQRMSAPDYFKRPAAELTADAQSMETLDSKLMAAYQRLESLDSRQST